jgi:hypothetical protein
MPDIFATQAKAKGLQTHGLVDHVTGQNNKVGPRQLIAVLFLHWPKQSACLIKVGIVGPGVDGGKALVTPACAASAVDYPIRAGGMSGHTNHQAAVMAPVGGPPVLAIGH